MLRIGFREPGGSFLDKMGKTEQYSAKYAQYENTVAVRHFVVTGIDIERYEIFRKFSLSRARKFLSSWPFDQRGQRVRKV